MSHHTPGSWKISPLFYGYLICNNNLGRIIAELQPDSVSKIECEANAKLIAAAPEMLELLQELLEWWDYDQSWRPADEMNSVREILKKVSEE
jgi:hypothetical protein